MSSLLAALGPDVVAQLAVVVVLDDEKPLDAGPRDQRHPACCRQSRAQRELVCRGAVDGREAAREFLDDQPVAVDRHRHHDEPRTPQRPDGALVPRLLDGHVRAGRQGPGQFGDRRGRPAGGDDGVQLRGQTAMAQQVGGDGAAEGRQPDGIGHDVGRLVAGGAPGPPPRGPVQRRHAGRTGAQVDGRRRGRRAVHDGLPRRGAGTRRRPGRRRHHERPGPAPSGHPPLGQQLVVGRRRHRPAHPEIGRQRPGRRQPLAHPHRSCPRGGPQRVGELGRQRNARLPVRHKREKLHEWPPGIGSNWPS